MRLAGSILTLAAASVVFDDGADAFAETVAIEAHATQRPPDAERYLAPVFAGLTDMGVLAGPDAVGTKYEEMGSRSGGGVDSDMLAEFSRNVETGCRSWLDNADFEGAVPALVMALKIAVRASVVMTADSKRRPLFRQALVCLAMSYKGLGRADDAARTVGEFTRNFRKQPLTTTEFDPDTLEFFKATQAALEALKPGVLEVSVSDPNVIIYVGTEYAGIGKAKLTGLVPGPYRVLLRTTEEASRVYVVQVRSGETASLQIDWAFDGALHTSPTWTGFLFRNDETRATLIASHAATFGRVVGADVVIAVSVVQGSGKRALVGQAYELGRPTPIRSRSLSLSPEPTLDALKAMGTYLASGVGDDRPDDDGERRWFPVVATSTAAVAGGVMLAYGAHLMGEDGRCDPSPVDCQRKLDNEPAGAILTLSGGAVLVGSVVSLLLWSEPHDEVPAVGRHVVRKRDRALVAATSGLLAAGSVPLMDRSGPTWGTVTGSSFLSATLGWWIAGRAERPIGASPIITVGGGGVSMYVGASF